MKRVNLFLIGMVLLASCQKEVDEEVVDLDQMAMIEVERNPHLAIEPLETPQEVPADESDSL